MDATTDIQPSPLAGPPRLELTELGEHRVVHLNGHLVARFRASDRGTERVLMTQLAEVLPLKDRDIAQVFQLHPVSLSRLRALARDGGAAALMPRRSGPQGPSKLTAQLQRQIEELGGQGLSSRKIAKRLSRGGRKVSHALVASVLKKVAAQPQPQALPIEPPVPLVDEPGLEPSQAVGERWASRYAGALMLYAGLAKLKLFEVFESLGASAGPARWFGWRQIVAATVFCFALRFRSIEDSKNALREDLGVLLGRRRSPGVLSLRGKLAALAESVEPVSLSRELFRQYLALEPVWEGLYYVDGYFSPYYGRHSTPKGWDAKRRLAVKGHTDAYVHDAEGRALFFISQPLNNSLARAIPQLVEEIRRVHGESGFALVFDRGGYSGEVFRYLRAQGIGFITYLKGRKAHRRFPLSRFQLSWFEFEQQRHTYRVYEKSTRVTGAGLVRTLVFLGDEGQQIPVLTNLDASFQPAKVIHCLRLRWRQENSFKYLSEHYGIDQIIQYGAEPEQHPREVPNPRRKRLKEKLAAVREEVEALEAELGRALDQSDEAQHRTARGLKIAHSRLRRRLGERRQVLARLENRLRHTPATILASEVDKQRWLLREDRRLVVNTIKLAAYNAERLLALQFNNHYDRRQDVFSVFRALLQLPGELYRVSPDRLEVRLQRPDSQKVATALEALLNELNQESPRMLGDGPVLSFAIQA
jgi:DNA-binding CsgD family transcriptional regulator